MGHLSKWIKGAKSLTLNFWGDKTNRTYVVNLLVVADSKSQIQIVPYGTWQFTIYAHAAADKKPYRILTKQGNIDLNAKKINGTEPIEKWFFEGQPYVERSDEFFIDNISDEDIEVFIVYDRIMAENT